MFEVTRRVDEPVSVRMLDEKTIRAERLLRIKAAVKHVVFKEQRETRHRLFQPQVVAALGADRADGAGEQRLVGLMETLVTFRLGCHGGKIADFLKTRGANWRQVSQLMQVASTKKLPGTLLSRRFLESAIGYPLIRGAAAFRLAPSAARHRYQDATVR